MTAIAGGHGHAVAGEGLGEVLDPGIVANEHDRFECLIEVSDDVE
jgi:hypothetical protein